MLIVLFTYMILGFFREKEAISLLPARIMAVICGTITIETKECDDDVTLITRPRRFGKTLNISMTEQFFSLDYAGRGDLFEGLSI